MKKIISILLAVVLAVPACLYINGEDTFEPTDGVYRISSKEQLILFRDLVNGINDYEGQGDPDACAVLLCDITLNSGIITSNGEFNTAARIDTLWMPIGYHISSEDRVEYNGTFDGGGYTVTGVAMEADEVTSCGFFGLLGEDAVVKNLTVSGSYIECPDTVGAIAGQNDGVITNCHSTGNLIIANNAVCGGGGIVGIDNGTVFGCTNTSSVFVTSSEGNHAYAGGISARSTTLLERCSNSGNVSGDGASGGISGMAYAAKNCFNAGEIVGATATGGILGIVEWSVENCLSYGGIFSDSDSSDYIASGGIVGEAYAVLFKNNYYKAAGINGVGTARYGHSFANSTGLVEKVTKSRLASGEIAYLLGEAFGQLLGTESEPHLSKPTGEDRVLKVTVLCEDGGTISGNYTSVYANAVLTASGTDENVFMGWYNCSGVLITRNAQINLGSELSSVTARFTTKYDSNLDGKVDIADVLAFDAYLTGKSTNGYFSDLNGDGAIDVSDLKEIIARTTGN